MPRYQHSPALEMPKAHSPAWPRCCLPGAHQEPLARNKKSRLQPGFHSHCCKLLSQQALSVIFLRADYDNKIVL